MVQSHMGIVFCSHIYLLQKGTQTAAIHHLNVFKFFAKIRLSNDIASVGVSFCNTYICIKAVILLPILGYSLCLLNSSGEGCTDFCLLQGLRCFFWVQKLEFAGIFLGC